VAAVVLARPGAALGQAGLGDALVLCSVFTWVGGGVIVQRLAGRLDTALISTAVTLAGTAMLGLHVLLDPALRWPAGAAPGPAVWAAIVLSGLLATALGALVWNRALAVLGVARASLYAYWVPIFGVLAAVVLLGEPLTPWHGVGLVAVLGGTWLGTRPARAAPDQAL
jgi:drug/metabolite transporter (DMT)-like permease